MKTLKERIMAKLHQRGSRGASNCQIMKTLQGIGDPQRLMRFLQSEGKVTSEWVKRKIQGQVKHYKIYRVA